MKTILFAPQALHIPDGFLSVAVSILFWLLSAAIISAAVRRSGEQFDERQVPLMGIMAAFIFAGQMINFPVAGGTSGHLLGGALAAIVLGPWAGILAMTAVIGVQALLFQDGGLLAMGANIFNMGILTALLGYGVYAGFRGRPEKVRLIAAGFAAWLSVIGSAFATALQLWLSGTAGLGVVMPVMLGVHALIGVGEALITAAALAYIFRARPTAEPGEPGRGWAVAGAGAALVILLLAPFASVNPDGLERVAQDLSFAAAARSVEIGLLPNYIFPGLGDAGFATVAAGLVGLITVVGLGFVLSRVLRRRADPEH